MKYLNKWNQIFEAVSDENVKRSERLLSQAQREYEDTPELREKDGPMPTMVFTDVVGSSKMWSDDAITMSKQLEGHHKLVDSLADDNNGWIVKTIGDAFMVYFEPSENSLYNAMKFAKDLIIREKAYNLRIGICEGMMDQKTYRIQKVDLKDFFGNTVNTASRMESKVAEVGGTIAFCSTKSLENKLVRIKTLGEVKEVELSRYDLRGARISKAYKMKVK
jgi:class 3 adenylate cyclase